jgi:hypothetical protein
MLYELATVHETKETEEVRDGNKYKVKYLVQHRQFPARPQAVDLLKKLRANMKTMPEILSMNTNGQNLSRNLHGITFNEGDREENVTNKLVKDKDKKLIDSLEKEKNRAPADTRTAEEIRVQQLREKYQVSDAMDVQHTFRIINLVLDGDPSEPNYFEKGKAEFEKFVETVKEHILQTKKTKIRANSNFRKHPVTDKFMGVSF